MVAVPHTKFTERDYLLLEAHADTKHEFVGGYIVAMAGAELVHNTIAGNALFDLRTALAKRSCIVVGSDQRVRIDSGREYVYPDVSVVCGTAHTTDTRPRSITNPTMLVEVLYASTALYDLTVKLPAYQTIPSATDLVFIDSERRRVIHYQRQPEGQWAAMAAHERITLHDGLGLDVAALYRDTDL